MKIHYKIKVPMLVAYTFYKSNYCMEYETYQKTILAYLKNADDNAHDGGCQHYEPSLIFVCSNITLF